MSAYIAEPDIPERMPLTDAERQADRDFQFFDRLMRSAPGSD